MRIVSRLAQSLNRTGYEVRRTDAKRRAELFRHHQVDLVLDVGAGRGQYATELRRSGYRGRIISFEPLDGPFAELQELAAKDRAWTAIHRAAGAQSETLSINVAGNSSSSSFLPMLDRHEEVAPHTRYVGSQVIEVRPLDQLALTEVRAARNSILKVDTQGYERWVLDGAAEVIELVRGIQIELSFVPLYEGGMLFDEAIDRLLGEGFELQMLEPGFRDPSSQQLLQADAIFVRPR